MSPPYLSPAPGIQPAIRLPGGGLIRHAAWSAGGGCLAAALENGGVRLWSGIPDPLREASVVPAPRDFQALDTPVDQVAWSPDGRAIAAVSFAGKRITVWNARSLEPGGVIGVDGEEILCAAWSGENVVNAAVVIGTHPRQRIAIRGYDAASGALVHECLDETRDSAPGGVSADGRLLAAGRGNAVQVWDVARARIVATVRAQPRKLHGVALTPNGRTLVLSVNEGEIHACDVSTGRRRGFMYEHARPAHSIVCSHDGRLMASKSLDGSVRLWRCDRWEWVATLPEASHGQPELSFRPGTLTLTSYDGNNTALRVWGIDYEQAIRGNAMITILMLSSDPLDGRPLRLGEEEREILEQLQRAGLRSRFSFHSRTSVRPKDFSRGLLELRPRIVHFSGHGGNDGSVWLEDDAGRPHPVAPDDLAMLMEQMSEHVECVILNACHTETQAAAISQSIRYAIGTDGMIDDDAAVAFSVGFYQALGEGHSIEKSYKLGCAQIRMRCGGKFASAPVLRRKRSRGTRAAPASV